MALSSREEQGLIVLVSVITSCLQTLHSCDSKLAALELILHLAPRLAVDILLDRITPYLLHFCGDPVPRVRAQAVRTLAKVLALVKEVPRNDVNIYPEYILPGIAHLAQDDATIVRLAYAGQGLRYKHIGPSVSQRLQVQIFVGILQRTSHIWPRARCGFWSWFKKTT